MELTAHDDALPSEQWHAVRAAGAVLPAEVTFLSPGEYDAELARYQSYWESGHDPNARERVLAATQAGRRGSAAFVFYYDAVVSDGDELPDAHASLRVCLRLADKDRPELNRWLAAAASGRVPLPKVELDRILFARSVHAEFPEMAPSWWDFLDRIVPALAPTYTLELLPRFGRPITASP